MNSCNTVFPRDRVCLRYICISTLHKGDEDDNDDDDNNNNGKSAFKTPDRSECKKVKWTLVQALRICTVQRPKGGVKV